MKRGDFNIMPILKEHYSIIACSIRKMSFFQRPKKSKNSPDDCTHSNARADNNDKYHLENTAQNL